MATCPHQRESLKDVQPKTQGCEECEAQGRSDWVSLRMCATCGHVGGCDSSPGGHARKHFEEAKHPIIYSGPKKPYSWKWCYVCNAYV